MPPVTTGLVSITFRALTPPAILRLMQTAGLQSVEWGSDVHVPPGNLAVARDVARLTREAGLQVSSYGSYYRAAQDPDTFDAILSSAAAMGAPRIRIWAGNRNAEAGDAAYRDSVLNDIRRVAQIAARQGIGIALEFHGESLTNSAESAAWLLEHLQDVGVTSYWQPRLGADVEACVRDLKLLAPWIAHAHVFHWQPWIERQPLVTGAERWRVYLNELLALNRALHLQIEYVAGDRPEQLLADAAALGSWLASAAAGA